MANTTNFNWETPDDTDLVKDGAAAIRTLGSAIDTSLVDLKGGTTGQVLSKATNTDMDFTWVAQDDSNAIQNALVDAKGDLIAASAADTPARLPVGTNNQRLVAASGETTGLKYVSDTQNTVVDAEGDLLVGDSADTLQRLAIGTTGQILTVDTTVDGKIKWAAAAGGGGMTLLSTTTLSGSSTSISSISGSYKNLLLIINGVKCSNNNQWYLRTNGSFGGWYEIYGESNTSPWTENNGNDLYLGENNIKANDANNTFAVLINNYASTTAYKPFSAYGSYINSSSATKNHFSAGAWRSTSAITSIDINTGAGTFSDGTILTYGVS